MKSKTKGNQKKSKLKVALICGGPSLERGISLNSARSVCDHLSSSNLDVLPLYFDYKKNAYLISRAQLYCNTPSDFDFKLRTTAKPLSRPALLRFIKSVDIAFPAMHGPFGEDGGIQKLLEQAGVPFVGSPSQACRLAFDKHRANEYIRQHGFYAPASMVIERGERGAKGKIEAFFKSQRLKRAIVKPATGGSSIAVYSVANASEALARARDIMAQRVDGRVVIEPFAQGREFTVIILQNSFKQPIAILPTEIELDYRDHQIFDYRRKYLATRQVTYHCPPRFDDATVEKIQAQAEQLFSLFGMRDFGRFDGWVLDNGEIWFSDFNLVSGMEQNSFLFMQASRLGMSHRDLLRYVVGNACIREGLVLPNDDKQSKRREPVQVIFGGDTAERQVSLMSGTNVWLKLRRSNKYAPEPYLLDLHGDVWRLPYAFALNHTVEEVAEMCYRADRDRARLSRLRNRVVTRLGLKSGDLSESVFLPEKMSLSRFLAQANFVFLGLHGGIGEDGTIQKMLEKRRLPFNGPGSKASHLCMDKFETGRALKKLRKQGVHIAKKKILPLAPWARAPKHKFAQLWTSLTKELDCATLIVKPIDDGCSAGIARLYSATDLENYINCAGRGLAVLPLGTLTDQHGLVEMPTTRMRRLMFESFIETDKVRAVNNRLIWKQHTGWIEVTVGILERGGRIRALSPSMTVASGNVLSLEEKFQGGTGVNITPPPEPFISAQVLASAKRKIELVAKTLGLRGYSRIDAFLNRNSGEILVIEANTLPGLTPATVIYHQGLAEKPALYPLDLLEAIVKAGKERYKKKLR